VGLERGLMSGPELRAQVRLASPSSLPENISIWSWALNPIGVESSHSFQSQLNERIFRFNCEIKLRALLT
jgi:hypothetical protein